MYKACLCVLSSVFVLTCSTILIEPGWTATITAERNVRINSNQKAGQQQQQAGQQAVQQAGQQQDNAAVQGITCDPIQLAIFSHRCACGRCGQTDKCGLQPGRMCSYRLWHVLSLHWQLWHCPCLVKHNTQGSAITLPLLLLRCRLLLQVHGYS